MVLDWDTTAPEVTANSYAMDPRLLGFISRSTMCYLPCLHLPTVVEVICAAKPSLYFGSDLVGATVHRWLVGQPLGSSRVLLSPANVTSTKIIE
jgi:hypothetical protein